MAQRGGSRSKTGATRAKPAQRKPAGPKAMGQLEKALEAAETALKELRGQLGRGGSAAVKDLNQTVKDSRKHLRSLSKTVVSDLEKLQSAAGRATPSRSTGRSAAARKTSTRSTAARKSSSGSTAARKTSARSTSARKSPAKPRSPRGRK